MDKAAVERRVSTAMEHAAPDVLERVMVERDQKSGSAAPMVPVSKRPRWKAIVAAAAALFILCGGGYGWKAWQEEHRVDSVVMLDVNPSISLLVNAKEKVISANALNEDAKVVLGDMDLTGTSLNVAVNALIGSMLQNGYLGYDNLENCVLVSVENGDLARAAQLQQRVREAVDGVLRSSSVNSSLILTQSVENSNDLQSVGEQYGISAGKAALIREVISGDPSLSFDVLAPLSVNEIALIAGSRGVEVSSVDRTGAASEAAYIGAQSALDRACAHAGLTGVQLFDERVDFDIEDGCMTYEVEFCAGAVGSPLTEYDYEIDARTGAVLRFSHEVCTHSHHGWTSPAVPSSGPVEYVGEAAARDAAIAHAGVSAAETVYLNCWLSYDDGVPEHYEVEFMVGRTRYEYEIDMYTAAVLKSEQETWPDTASPNSTPASAPASTPSPAACIGEDAACGYALNHVGCAVADVLGLNCRMEYDDGVPECYEVEFCHNGIRYEYEIGLYDGSILCHQQETCNNGTHGHHSSGQGHHGGHHGGWAAAFIGREAAKAAAFSHAGVSAADVCDLSVKQDVEDGVSVYEVDFKAGGMEYEYEIDASTGAVLKYESELDD